MPTDFDSIVDQIRPEMPDFPAEEKRMALMPEVTPGEGGAFGLAALLIGAGLLTDMSQQTQLAAIIGGVVLGVAGVFTTGGIRKARNNTAAAQAMGDAFTNAVEDEDDHG